LEAIQLRSNKNIDLDKFGINSKRKIIKLIVLDKSANNSKDEIIKNNAFFYYKI
jgi:hypothetical protein